MNSNSVPHSTCQQQSLSGLANIISLSTEKCTNARLVGGNSSEDRRCSCISRYSSGSHHRGGRSYSSCLECLLLIASQSKWNLAWTAARFDSTVVSRRTNRGRKQWPFCATWWTRSCHSCHERNCDHRSSWLSLQLFPFIRESNLRPPKVLTKWIHVSLTLQVL